MEPARRLARGGIELALRADVAPRDRWPAVRGLPRGERGVARAVVPPARRAGRDRDGPVLSAPPPGPPAPGQAQPAPEARLYEHCPAGRARGAHGARDLQAAAIQLADSAVRRVPGGPLLALLDRLDLRGLHDRPRDPRVRRRSPLAPRDVDGTLPRPVPKP